MNFNDVEKLEKHFRDRYYSNFITTKNESAHILYTDLLGTFGDNSLTSIDIQSRLVEEIEKNSHRRSFVVFGDSGSGKTTLALHLCDKLWRKWETSDEESRKSLYIPIYIPLRQIELSRGCLNLLSNFCKIYFKGIEDQHLFASNLILFLDGYDELKEKINLWQCNNWGSPFHCRNIKTITFCKTIVLKVSEREHLFTLSESEKGEREKSHFIFIQPFKIQQIENYVEKTVKFLKSMRVGDDEFRTDPWVMTKLVTNHTVWENDTTEYRKWLIEIFPHLKKLASNPYLLTIILQILPNIVEKCKSRISENHNICPLEREIRARISTEVGVYDEFVSQWFKYQTERSRWSQTEPDFFKIPSHHQCAFMRAYAQNLSFNLMKENGGLLTDGTVSEADSNLWHLWKPIHNDELLKLIATDSKYSELFPTDEYDTHVTPDTQSKNESADEIRDKKKRIQNLQALRSACLLTSLNNGTFKFFHSSLVEYFASREIFENIRGRFNFYLQSDSKDNDEFGINTTDLTEASFLPILKHLAQRAQTDDTFKTLLFEIIDKSKEIFILRRMSANAVTILNIAGVSLSGKDFRNVQFPNANLTGANLANSDFQFANLEGANLQQSWMVGCKFQGANFRGVNFGQVSSMTLNSGDAVAIEPYLSNNGENCLIVIYRNGKIENYNYNSGVVSEIKCLAVVVNFDNVPYIVGNRLLIHSIDDHFKKIPVKTSVVRFKVWNLDESEQMEDILVHCSGPILQHDDYINAEFLKIAYGTADHEMAGDLKPKAFNVHPPASFILLARYTNCGNTDGESYYYHEIGLVKKFDLRLAILWTYIVEKGHVRLFKEPQILEICSAVPEFEDKIIFRLYADISVTCWHVHLSEARSAVAIKCSKFVKFYSIVTTNELIFDEILQTDPFTATTTITVENIKFSPNGQYLIYRSDFVYLWNINSKSAPVEILQVDTSARYEKCFLVIFDKSSEMVAFLYIDTIFICTLPSGTFIKKIFSKNLQIVSFFPTFAFIEHTNGYPNHLFGKSDRKRKVFSYVSVGSFSLETIIISDTIEPSSNQQIQGLVLKIRVSEDNRRVVTFHRDNKEDHFISVYDTPISSDQALRFQKAYRYIYVYDMVFTPNYLLVTLNDKVLVFDMNGKYSSVNTNCNNNNWKIPFLSSEYQKILFCENLTVEYQLQLCTISETVTATGLPSVDLKKIHKKKCFRQSFVSDVRFDSRDGNVLLLQTHLDLNRDGFPRILPNNYSWWMWIPSQNYAREILLQPAASIVEFQHVFRNMVPKVSNQIDAFFFTTTKKTMCVSDTSGYYFVNISDTKSLKRERYCLTYKDSENVTKSKFFPNVDWFVYGTSRCHLCIYSVKNSTKLAEFLLPHPVYDFNLQFNYGSDNGLASIPQSVQATIWSVGGFFSSLTFGTTSMFRDWKIDWTVKSHSVLKLENVEIAKSYKVNVNNGWLKSLNVNLSVGEPWPINYNYISLSELYIPITKIDTKYPILTNSDCSGSRATINENLWVVSAIAKNANSNCTNSNKVFVEHVGLLIEGIMNGRHFVWEAHLTRNKKKKSVRINLFPLSNTKRLDELVNDHIARQWVRRKSEVQNLIKGIQNDQITDLKYDFFRKNCTSWCVEKLKLARIFDADCKTGFMKFCKVDKPSDLFLLRDEIVKTRLSLKLSKKLRSCYLTLPS